VLIITEQLVKILMLMFQKMKKKFCISNRAVWGGFGALGMLELLMRIMGK